MRRTHRIDSLALIAVSPSLIVTLAGCQDLGNQLYIANTTKLGLNASLNSTRQAGSVGLGYDRYFVTWVPRSVDQPAETGSSGSERSRDVMSVLACSRLVVDGLSIDDFDESLATGEAAQLFAAAAEIDESNTSKDYFKCFRETGPLPKNTGQNGTSGESQ